MDTARRTLKRLGILLACVYVAWLVFIDPTYSALNDDEPLLVAALAASIAAEARHSISLRNCFLPDLRRPQMAGFARGLG
jgi:hypothetical protein